MDNIIISTKDADKICKIIRDRLIELDRVFNSTTQEADERYELLNNFLASVIEENNEEYNKWKDEAHNAMVESKNKLTELHNKKKEEYTFILEIMMAGSTN